MSSFSYAGQINDGRSRYDNGAHGLPTDPHFENRSPSPSIKRNNQAVNHTDFGNYNPLTDRRESIQNPLANNEDSTVLISLLDEVDDDFRLTIYKLQVADQQEFTRDYQYRQCYQIPNVHRKL